MTTRAMFAGYDASGNTNLWVTDGDSGGKSELTAVGAASGLNPSGITVLGTKALFQGIDASSRVGLWVSDGTSGRDDRTDSPRSLVGRPVREYVSHR